MVYLFIIIYGKFRRASETMACMAVLILYQTVTGNHFRNRKKEQPTTSTQAMRNKGKIRGKKRKKMRGKWSFVDCGVVVPVPKSSISGRKSHVQFVSLYILMVFHKDIYIEMDQS